MSATAFAFDLERVRRLAIGWPQRATVRSDFFVQFGQASFAPEQPDYPVRMVPFWDHPRFARIGQEIREAILAWAWIVYNRRTIAAEENVANPAFALLMANRFPYHPDSNVRKQIQQSLIDEHFHTLMHMLAIERTKQLRDLADDIAFPDSVTYRRLLQAQAEVAESWERDLLVLIFAIVSEISINAYLERMSKDTTIQPLHSLITRLHDRDEYAHAALLAEIGKPIYAALNERQKASFTHYLPYALHAFLEQDYSAWECILRHYRVPGYEEILRDCRNNSSHSKLSRDFSGLDKLAAELGIKDQLDFEF